MAAAEPPQDSLEGESPLQSPTSPPTTPDPPASIRPDLSRLSPRSLSASATTAGMTTSSTPLGPVNAARRPAPHPPTISSRGSGLNVNADILARIQRVSLGRQGAPARPPATQPGTPQQELPASSQPQAAAPLQAGGIPAGFRMPPGMGSKPQLQNTNSAPAVPNLRMGGGNKPSLAEKRGLRLPGGLPGSTPSPGPMNTQAPPAGGKRNKPGLSLGMMNGGTNGTNNEPSQEAAKPQETLLEKYKEFLDPKTGALKFKGKAVLTSGGVEFASGQTFNISLDEVDTLDELGKGNYGTVYKVRHSRPRMRRPGQGLAGNKALPQQAVPESPTRAETNGATSSPTTSQSSAGTTGVIMAMKEIRLELDDSKFAAIIMELDILHRCISPFIVDFYGAFFQEGAVYVCLEFMNGGSIDKLYGDGIPENILRKIAYATTMGLKFLKDDHNIIHRDVKPTNILMNTKGAIKICDFGVSGNLVASIAKTNIGCQSYMAPERISSGGVAQAGANPGGGTYSVQSDIWSLGLTIIECAMGRYPYPPETYNNIFSQLSAIVDGEPPDLPPEGYSDAARNFVHGCLNKIPNLRPTYAMLLQHAWLAPMTKPSPIQEVDEEAAEAVAAADSTTVDLTNSAGSLDNDGAIVDKEVADWVVEAIQKKKNGTMGKGRSVEKPALHAAPLDAVPSPVASPASTPTAVA